MADLADIRKQAIHPTIDYRLDKFASEEDIPMTTSTSMAKKSPSPYGPEDWKRWTD